MIMLPILYENIVNCPLRTKAETKCFRNDSRNMFFYAQQAPAEQLEHDAHYILYLRVFWTCKYGSVSTNTTIISILEAAH